MAWGIGAPLAVEAGSRKRLLPLGAGPTSTQCTALALDRFPSKMPMLLEHMSASSLPWHVNTGECSGSWAEDELWAWAVGMGHLGAAEWLESPPILRSGQLGRHQPTHLQ